MKDENDNAKFKSYLDSIPFGKYKGKRSEIIKKCHITGTVFVDWRTGRTAIPELAKPVIEAIAGKNIF